MPIVVEPIGPGLYPIELEVSEALTSVPLLTVTPKGQNPLPINLEPITPEIWQGTLTVTQEMASGLANFAFQANDLIGNVGNQIASGGSLALDTQGPIGALSFLPSPLEGEGSPAGSPVQQTQGRVRGSSVAVFLDLDESAVETPQLSLIPSGKTPISVSLSSKTAEAKSFTGVLTISSQTGDGVANFIYSAQDALGNISALLQGTTSFIIDTIPPSAPRFLRANPAKAGAVVLSWSAPLGTGPAGDCPLLYFVYRDGIKLS
ncbi:MAG: hypothetical protein HY747_06705, partial [Elusimicrobia bacterium]|nr:hypothetical protein [Elusimicrobiota bacterium]